MKNASTQSGFRIFDDGSAPKVPRQVSMQASEWMVRLQDADVDGDTRKSFQEWHDAHPDHATAWACLSRFSAYLHEINTPLLNQTLMAQSHKDEAAALRGAGRRRAVKTLTIAAFTLGASGLLLRQTALWDRVQADHATGTGEQRDITLADGTHILLNTHTAIEVHYSSEQRLVRLMHGEILVTTAAHVSPADGPGMDGRPFLVQARDGLLQALGTRFTVRQEDEQTSLGVLEGAVRIIPHQNQEATLIVQAGQAARFTRTQIGLAQTLEPADAAWAEGVLIAHEMPLPLFLDELGRYRRGLLVCDSSAAHLRVSGVYPVADTDRVLYALERNLPVRVRRRTPYWVTVAADIR